MNISKLLESLCLAPAPSGYEKESATVLYNALAHYVDEIRIDHMGTVIGTIRGTDSNARNIMVSAHMDQLGFIVRRIEANGFIQIDRLGGVPEKILPALRIVIRNTDGDYIPGVIGTKAHHAASAEEKYKVDGIRSLFVDVGVNSRDEVKALGIEIGCPAVYEPNFRIMGGHMASGTAIDNRCGCTAMVYAASLLKNRRPASTVHFVGSVWEEFNIRGAVFAARKLKPDILYCLDVALASDVPGMDQSFDNILGGGPTIDFYTFHGRGTLNGTIPNEGLVKLAMKTAQEENITVQRFAALGMVMESAYVQMENEGIACLDFGIPTRYTHSPVEMCSIDDIESLGKLLCTLINRINVGFNINRY